MFWAKMAHHHKCRTTRDVTWSVTPVVQNEQEHPEQLFFRYSLERVVQVDRNHSTWCFNALVFMQNLMFLCKGHHLDAFPNTATAWCTTLPTLVGPNTDANMIKYMVHSHHSGGCFCLAHMALPDTEWRKNVHGHAIRRDNKRDILQSNGTDLVRRELAHNIDVSTPTVVRSGATRALAKL